MTIILLWYLNLFINVCFVYQAINLNRIQNESLINIHPNKSIEDTHFKFL